MSEVMKRHGGAKGVVLVLVLLALGMLPGCGGQSPGEAVKRHLELLNDRHFDQFYDAHLEASSVGRLEFIQIQEAAFPAGAQITDIDILKEEVSGDRATVELSYRKETPGLPDERVRTTVELVKEVNQPWKILGGI